MGGSTLGDLAEWADSHIEQLIERAHAAIVERMDLYRDTETVSSDDLRSSVAHNLRFMIDALRDTDAPLDLAAPSETGRRRAHQGAPLPEVLRAYRLSFGTLWDALLERAQTDGQESRDALLDAASRVWRVTDEHALALTEAYRVAMSDLLMTQQRRRSALVEALLTGVPGPDGGPREAAKLLGLASDTQFVVVAAETRGLAEESLTDIELRLASERITSAWRLSPALQLGVVSVKAGQEEPALDILRSAATARAGVSPLYRSLADTPRALHLARVALAGMPAGRAGVRMFSASPLAALVACEPDEARRIAHQVLGAVLDLPTEDRDVLLETLDAYLEHGGSAEQAARVLYCHPNTVRYRLRRLHELTGQSLSDPRSLAELAAATYAVDIDRTP